VSEEAWTDIGPSAAMVHVVLTASRLFSGQAALRKAEEIRALAIALEACGLPDDALALEGAALDVSTGLFTRSSSVTYRLRIEVRDLDQLGEVLDAVARAKQARLTHLAWEYPVGVPASLLRECAERALAKAEILAAALRLTLAGVQSVRHTRTNAALDVPVPCGGVMPAMRSRGAGAPSIASELGSLELAPKRRVNVELYLDCRIAPATPRA
jgi:hypothetical protein